MVAGRGSGSQVALVVVVSSNTIARASISVLRFA